MATDFTLLRSRRRSIGLRLLPDGALIVRAPKFLPLFVIKSFVRQKWTWVERKRVELQEQSVLAPMEKISLEDQRRLKREAAEYFKQRCEYFAAQMGVRPTQVRISSARTRWGSCSSKGRINLNWKLMLTNTEAIDYVVVHELAHLKHMNHSREFWNCVGSVLSNYRERSRQLRAYEQMLRN